MLLTYSCPLWGASTKPISVYDREAEIGTMQRWFHDAGDRPSRNPVHDVNITMEADNSYAIVQQTFDKGHNWSVFQNRMHIADMTSLHAFKHKYAVTLSGMNHLPEVTIQLQWNGQGHIYVKDECVGENRRTGFLWRGSVEIRVEESAAGISPALLAAMVYAFWNGNP
ncbi:hypothetical protein [Marinococcus luteus]|uniref:hypothetical protein n=1 Tax=Marinococcus luteus TaxID=1122204 RepID=UPI002ACC9BF2|nr:hypothetical protein [Marinococcus luteus]MDZ5781918.1 hypothetical protein [Marinococcus luteus]